MPIQFSTYFFIIFINHPFILWFFQKSYNLKSKVVFKSPSFCYLLKLGQTMLCFVQIVALISWWFNRSWLHQPELLIFSSRKLPLHNVSLLPLSFVWNLQNLVAEGSNENHIWTCNVLLLNSEKLPFVFFFFRRPINICSVFIRFNC